MKPSDIFIGVTDFFSVLLPGSILTWFCHCYSYQTCLELKLPVCLPQERSEQIALFLAVAYIVGNLLFIAASKIDDWFYDPFRKKYLNKNEDICFESARQIRDEYIVCKELQNALVSEEILTKINFDDIAKKQNGTKKYKKWEVMNTYKWALCFIGITKPELLEEVKKHEADSKFFRSLIIAFLIIAFAILLKENNGNLFIIFLVLAFLSFYRYADLRYKSTEKAYQIVITLHHSVINNNDVKKP
jgi:hypothetical protein